MARGHRCRAACSQSTDVAALQPFASRNKSHLRPGGSACFVCMELSDSMGEALPLHEVRDLGRKPSACSWHLNSHLNLNLKLIFL